MTGAAITWGRTTASGIGFDFDELLSDQGQNTPDWQAIPVGDHRSFEDTRTFFGVYAHDEWTPARAFTISGGGRCDHAHEKLHAFGQEVGGDRGRGRRRQDVRALVGRPLAARSPAARRAARTR